MDAVLLEQHHVPPSGRVILEHIKGKCEELQERTQGFMEKDANKLGMVVEHFRGTYASIVVRHPVVPVQIDIRQTRFSGQTKYIIEIEKISVYGNLLRRLQLKHAITDLQRRHNGPCVRTVRMKTGS